MAAKTTTGVQSVERAFELLELMGRAGGECSLSELSAGTPLPPPTIHRLLRTLVGIGYVQQLPNRRYALGPRLIRLGEVANRQLGAVALPVLQSLVAELDEAASLAVLDGDMMVYVGQVQPAHSTRTDSDIGSRVYLHNTGVGKAVLAGLDDARIVGLMAQAGIPATTEHSVSMLSGVFAEVEGVRERGYAIDAEEQDVGVRCLAMAVPEAPTRMAISITGPADRLDAAFEVRAVRALRRATAEISDALIGARET